MLSKELRNVTDIIDIEYLQSIQDSFGRIVGITTVLLDQYGVAISAATNAHAFCAMMQAKENGIKMCIKTNEMLIAINQETKDVAVVTCPSSGLMTAAVPIYLGDEYLGSWLIGQIRMENIDYDLIERTSEKAGLSKEEAKRNIDLLPIISEQEFENILNFLITSTNALIAVVEANEELNKKNEDLRALATKLDSSARSFKDFINFTESGAYLVDYHTERIIMYNSRYKELVGLEDDQIENQVVRVIMREHGYMKGCPKELLVDEYEVPTGNVYSWESYNAKKDRWLNLTSRAVNWIDGRLVVMTTFVDITERKFEEERISYLAYHDQSLKIPNAVKLHADVREYKNENPYVICFDVKGLREINNVYGRSAGDNLLVSIVEWAKTLREKHNVQLYRIKGDDFALLLKDSNKEKVMELSNLIYERFDLAWQVDMGGVQQKMFTGVHMGMIQINKSVESVSSLLNIVERILTFARKESKPILFDQEMDREFREHMRLKVSLKSCVLNKMEGFSLNYQPVVDAKTGSWVGMEALCRWNSPELGVISPEIFITEAEQLGLIGMISDWVFNEAIGQTKAWGLDEKTKFSLSVNLSPLQLKDQDLLESVKSVLAKYDYPANRLSIEITETAEVHFDAKTIETLKKIREAGISLSLDDFGIGYATFSHLKNLPLNMLKTDRSFVIGIEEDEFLQHTMRIMVDLAHAAGLQVTSEGIETETQRKIIVESGVNLIQGFYFSRPLNKETMCQSLGNFKY